MAIFESFQPENVYLSPAKLIKKTQRLQQQQQQQKHVK